MTRARGLRLEGCCCCFTCLREVHGACLVSSLVSRGDDEQQQHQDAKEQPTGDARADRDSDGSDSDDDSDSDDGDSDDGDSGDAGGSEQSGGSADGCGHRQRAPPPFPRELHGLGPSPMDQRLVHDAISGHQRILLPHIIPVDKNIILLTLAPLGTDKSESLLRIVPHDLPPAELSAVQKRAFRRWRA